MLMDPSHKKIMPDIAQSEKSSFQSPLEWVGMEKVALPLILSSGDKVPAQADIFVNLSQSDAKGIHMSRLYLALQEGFKGRPLDLSLIKEVLDQFVASQKGLADQARMVVRWQEMHLRPALLSEYAGWKTYPVEVIAEKSGQTYDISLNFSIFYSSACPCSAALARQIYQQAFAKEFCEDNISFEKIFNWLGKTPVATPHSQRSRADIQLHLGDGAQAELSCLKYIDILEEALKTPVQTAVKREDEQEFARLNGENSMFVEDALRIIKQALNEQSELERFHVKTHHFESLHAHDAVGSIHSGL
jgi:GTP cyclohydrolase IB